MLSISVAFVLLTGFFIGIMTQTLYVINKNQRWLTLNSMVTVSQPSPLFLEYQLSISMSSLPISNDSGDIESTSAKTAQCTMEDVLADKDGFDSFFFHLRQEFSTEILVSMVEMTQFKESVYQYDKNELNHDDNWNPNMFLKYPINDMPKSDIVYDSMSDLGKKYEFYIKGIDDEIKAKRVEFIIRSYLLYVKYIKSDAEFQLNISFDTRSKLTQIMDSLGDWINYDEFDKMTNTEIMKYLYDIFDDCLQQMHTLLTNSFTRYQMSLLYEEFVRIWRQKRS